MSSEPPSAGRSPTADPPPADSSVATLIRLRGAPLLDALERHLPGSREHAEATGSYAFAAAVGLGLGRGAAELCRETAKLHDIGMVYVPREVAFAPYESLDPEQREAFDGHFEAGARLALGAAVPDDACGWLLQIRERFDGRGPDGLAGTAIPVASRIARAACACDLVLAPASTATADERRREALERLRDAAGHELDPDVVEALAGVLEAAGG